MNIEKILKQIANNLAKSTPNASQYDWGVGAVEMQIDNAICDVKIEIGEAILEAFQLAERNQDGN